jgi:hypothetical protein
MTSEEDNNKLSVGKLIARFPHVEWVSSRQEENGFWWVKFHLDLSKPTSSIIIQALAHILNGMSLNDPLPTRFFPSSSPPYLNGGPKEHLHWVIEPFSQKVMVSEIYTALDSTLLFDTASEAEWIDYPASDDEEES